MPFVVVKSKYLKFAFAFVIALFCLTLNIFNTNSAAGLFFGNTVRKVPIYSVATTEQKISISFDAAWGSDKTANILDGLKKFNAKATFYLVGFWAEENPELVKRIAEEGHEIGLHSNSHPDLTKLSKEEIKLELTTNQNIIENIVGFKPTYFRCPFGSYNDKVISVCEELGLTVIQWSIDSLDWKGLSAGDITKRVLPKLSNGSIVLFHNNSDHILDALEILLDSINKKGLSMVKISDLVFKENFIIDSQGIQRQK